MTATMETTKKRRSARIAFPRAMLLTLGLFAAACGSTRRNEPFVEDLTVFDESVGAVVGVQADPRIERRLATVIVGSRDVGGLKSYQLELRNVSAEDVDVSWTVDWFDRGGNRITPVRRTWKSVQLKAGEATPIEITAPCRSADSWRLVPVDTNTLQP